jgi:hypothetical protein
MHVTVRASNAPRTTPSLYLLGGYAINLFVVQKSKGSPIILMTRREQAIPHINIKMIATFLGTCDCLLLTSQLLCLCVSLLNWHAEVTSNTLVRLYGLTVHQTVGVKTIPLPGALQVQCNTITPWPS